MLLIDEPRRTIDLKQCLVDRRQEISISAISVNSAVKGKND